MPVHSNPKQRRVKILVTENASAILILRNYTPDEYTAFLEDRYKFKRRGKIEDQSMQARLKFIDTLLVDIEAEVDGNKDIVTYPDPATGEEKTLNNQVEGWKDHVSPDWKISAALVLENTGAEIEEGLVKN